MPDYSALKHKFGPHCLFGEPAANFTTYRAGGAAEVLLKPGTPEELAWACAWCRGNAAPWRVLGRGSNVLVSDRGLPGVTLLTGRLAGVEVKGSALEAQAGASWDEVAASPPGPAWPGWRRPPAFPAPWAAPCA